jgi:hypothetical protein
MKAPYQAVYQCECLQLNLLKNLGGCVSLMPQHCHPDWGQGSWDIYILLISWDYSQEWQFSGTASLPFALEEELWLPVKVLGQLDFRPVCATTVRR